MLFKHAEGMSLRLDGNLCGVFIVFDTTGISDASIIFFQFPVFFPLSRFLSEFLLSLLVCELYLLNSEIFAKFVIIV